MSEVTCPCGATYKGYNTESFIIEHSSAHAERVFALKPRLRDLLDKWKYEDTGWDEYPKIDQCTCDYCSDGDCGPGDCEICFPEDSDEEPTCECEECLRSPVDDRCPAGCYVCYPERMRDLPEVPEFCKNCKARDEANELARDRREAEEGWRPSIPFSQPYEDIMKKYSGTISTTPIPHPYTWLTTAPRSPEKND